VELPAKSVNFQVMTVSPVSMAVGNTVTFHSVGHRLHKGTCYLGTWVVLILQHRCGKGRQLGRVSTTSWYGLTASIVGELYIVIIRYTTTLDIRCTHIADNNRVAAINSLGATIVGH
jgi:hypothetical protein